MIVGVILIAVGVIALAQRLGSIVGSVWSYTWPLILIILGLSMLWGWRSGGRWHRVWGCPISRTPCRSGPCFPHHAEEERR